MPALPGLNRPHDTEPLPERGLTPARWVVALTAVCAAAGLAWSLHITPGESLFYPATFLVAAIYFAGSVTAAHVVGRPLQWGSSRDEIASGLLVGLGLAALFVAGAFLVRFLPFLRDPVIELLDHARVGNLWLVVITTMVNGVAEEVFYRGALWRIIRPRSRIVVTTLMYTLVTAMVGIPLLALAAAALGVCTALLRERYRTLTAPVLAHLAWSLPMLFVLPHIVK